jgi:hypothetical protein
MPITKVAPNDIFYLHDFFNIFPITLAIFTGQRIIYLFIENG